MVAIFSGAGLGLQRGSSSVLGATGLLGEASLGRGGDQVFVNAATGNLVVNRRDEFLVGRGPDAFYSQTYNSSADPAYTWAQSVYRVLTSVTGTINTAGSTVLRGDGDGHGSVYTYDVAKGAYVGTEGGGAHDEIRYSGGVWTWTDGNSRMSETYTSLSGVPGYYFLSSLSDADGNAQTYSWTSDGGIQRITNANGDYSQFTLSAGLPSQITTYAAGGSALLTRVRYVWDSLRRLTSVTVDLTPGDHSVADGKSYTSTYTYDGTSGRISSISQTDGSRLDIGYTQSGSEFRVTKLTQTVSSGVTRVTGLYYDLATRTTTITDALGGATTMRYDATGKLTQIAYPIPQPGATAPAATFAYNANGDVASVTQDGRTTTFDYDSNGNLTLSRDAAGNTVTRTYGSKNELLTSTEYLVPDPDGAGGATAGTPLTARYAYDSENHLRFKVSAEGRVTEYRYDSTGNLAATLDYTANLYNTAGLGASSSIAESTLAAWAAAVADKTTIARTDATYDYRGNVSTVTTYSKTLSDGSGDLGSTYSRITHVYDAAGNLLSRQTSGLSGSEAFLYDGLNRIVSATDAAGAVTSFSFNDSATTATVTLTGGLTRVSVFNKAGELISLTESAGDIATAVSTAAYDALGRLRMETDATGRTTYYLYDRIGRKAAAVTADGAMTEYGYDAGNRLVKSVAYVNKLTTSQIALLAGFSAGGAGGDSAGGVGGPIGSNLVSNGSFDQSGTFTTTTTGRSNTDLPGWTKANSETFEQVSSGQMGVTASDGAFWLDLESVAKTGVLTVGSNLIVNPGFEQSGSFTATSTGRSNTTLPGWTKTNAETFEQVASGQMGVTASEGAYWLDLESVIQTGMMTVGSNLLVNGSFDQSGSFTATATGRSNTNLPGWTKTNAETFEQVASGQMGVNGTDGAYWLDLESTASPGPQPIGSNLLVNGGFELSTSYTQTSSGRTSTVIPGWTKANSQAFDQVLAETTGISSTEGAYWLDLDSVPGSAGMVAGPNLIVNGSFEESAATYTTTATGRYNSSNIPGWTRAAITTQGFEQVNSGANGITASNGSFYLDMEANGGSGSRLDISQVIGGLTGSQQLTLKFDYANIAGTVVDHEGNAENSGALEVYWNGIKIAVIASNDSALATKSYTVTSVAGNNTLRFREIGVTDGKGVYLDNVQLYGMVAAPNGGNMDISQTVSNLTAGQVMQLQFDHANRTSATSGSFEVYWNNVLVATINSTGTTMQTKSYFVTAVAGNNVLRFKGTGTVDALGAALDNVRLFATQTPPHGGNMDISQTVSNLAAGQILQLQFDHANRTGGASGGFEVWWNGALVATVADTVATMQTKTYQLTAVAGNNTLRFRSLGTVDAAGASLDNVRLFAMAPVPSGGNMDISQTVGGLTAGQVMQLQFDHANRTTAASGSFEVYWNNVLVATINSTGTAMQTKTYLVTAVAGNNTLRFKSLGTVDNAGASIDNVRLFATQPVPSGGNMDISQTIGGLAAGQVMQLQFDHANRTTAASGSFEVWWNGTLVATVSETGTAMRTKTHLVTAVAGNNILRFKGLGTVDDAGASIDNVRLFAMQSGGPAPSAATDPLAGLRPTAHALDDWNWHIYDSADRLIETIDGAGGATTFAYDGASQLVSSMAYANAIAASTVAAFKTATPTALVLPAGNALTDRATRNFYDSDGHLVGTLDGAGGLTQIFHDAAGQKIREIAYANPVAASLRASGSFAQLLASAGTSASDRRVDYVYDQRGRIRFTIDALGHPTEYVHDSAGNLIRTVDYAGAISTSASYSLAYVQGQINAGLVSNPANRVSRSVYDGAGRLAFSIDAEGGTAAFGYDQLGNLVKQTRYSAAFTATGDQSLAGMQGWAASHLNDAGNRVSRQVFDGAGRTAYTVDAEGYVTEQRYDTAGRVTQTIRYPAPYSVGDGATKTGMAALIGGMPAAAVVTGYAYDPAGRLTDVTDGAGGVTHYVYDGLGQVTDETVAYGTSDAATLRRAYDAAGRVVSETEAHGTAEAGTTSFGYDALGNLLTITDARGSTTVREHDSLGRVVKTTAPIDASTNAVSQSVYNRFGEVVRATDARGNSAYNYYDRLGRVVATRDAEGYVTETAYTAFGDISSLTRRYNRANNAADAAVMPTYSAHANDATTGFLHDKLGRLTKTTDAEGHYEQYWYDAFGQRVSVRNKLGGITSNSYDRRGQLVAETKPTTTYDKWGNVTAWSVTNRFEYDSRGNCTRQTEAYGLAEQRVTSYVYDKLDRMTQVQHQAVTVLNQGDHASTSVVTPTEYRTYDRLGRLIESVDVLGARRLFYYDKLHRKTAELSQTSAGGPGTLSTCTYDANGNMLADRVYGTSIWLPGTAGGTAPAAPGGEYRETTYTYDKLDRVKTTNVANMRTGVWNGSYFAITTGTVTTAFDYDANGNVVRAVDGSGAVSFSFYDKANRRVAYLDQENYLTAYTLNGDGNVIEETRLANKVTVGVSAATDPVWLRSTVPASSSDRITQFGYDRNGRRTSQSRLNTVSSSVDGAGALGAGSTHSTVYYNYNGLGEVTQKTFANGDYVTYAYDSMGRLTDESRTGYTDSNGNWVRPTTSYFYDGVDNLSFTRLGGVSAAAGDRYTRYSYDSAGRMTQMTDAAGNSYNYYHDAAGNVLRENYNRTKSDGSVVTEGLLYTRDVLGRVTSRSLATWNGSSWVRGDTEQSAYNSYGDIAQRGVNGLWQEQFAYDGAGRIWRSNSGDGVWRFFVHDGEGRQTLSIESEGADLAGYTLDQAIAAATANGAYNIGGAYIDGINSTINVLDGRGQVVQTRLPKRQLNDSSAAVDLAVSRTYNAFGEVASETDARGYTTNFYYNTMGRLTQKQSPYVNATAENGVVTSQRPTENFYYDSAGRLVGTRDANNNLTTRLLLAGTGHGGSEGLVTYAFHADGGYARNAYDVFGDVRTSWDEINRRSDMVYDAMGRVTQVTRPNGLVENFGYDLLGQKTSHSNSFLQVPVYGPPEDVWVEDGYWDPYFGWVDTSHWETITPIVGYAPDTELTDYDLQGRVTRQVAFGGDTTTISYAWNGAIATNGMGTYGGWTETTTLANGRSSVQNTDLFGRQVYRSDLGGHVYNFSYDKAGRLIERAGTETLNYTWLNTGKVAQSFSATGIYGSDNWTRKGTTFGYDASGNLTSERLADEGHSYYEYWDPYYGYQYSDYSWSTVSKNASATYDALNRMVSWAEAGSATMASASTAFQYDLAGNIRRSYSLYRAIDGNGAQSGSDVEQDNWYRYDSLNRLVTKGSLVGGQIVRGSNGVDNQYDKAGQKVSALRTQQAEAYIYDPYSWDPYYGNQYMLVYYDAQTREDYSYDAAGVLTSVRIAQGGYTDNGDGTLTVNAPPAYAALRASYTNDLVGRVTHQVDWLGDGTNAAYDRAVAYNNKGQVTNETVINLQGADTIKTVSTYDYGWGANYALGAVVSTSASTYKNNVSQGASSTAIGYIWYEGALQSSISTTTTTYTPSYSSTTHTTTLTYDGSGSLTSIYVGDGRPRSISFVNDANGQTIKRDESDNKYNQGDPHEIWHRFGGKQMGYVGNNGTLDTDYATSITNRTIAQPTTNAGAFRFGRTYSSGHANFDLSGEPVTSYSQGVAAGGYTVRQGDTLETIAAQLWGDSSLWYRLAEANGMSAPNGLSEGQRITIPAGVMRNHHNATTFKPFDPSETIGDISPTTPTPQKAAKRGNKCGVFGIILLVVIAVAVTVVTSGALAAASISAVSGTSVGLGAGISAALGGTVAGGWGLTTIGMIAVGAAGAAAGSVASQAFGVATGIQEKFDWKGVAMAAISGGVGGGLGNVIKGAGMLAAAARGAVGSAITQGIGVATGLQRKFDWAGIAVAGITAGVEFAVGRALPGKAGDLYEARNGSIKLRAKPTFLNSLSANAAGAIAGEAARSALTGTSFGDNLISALPGMIGSTIGNSLAAELFGPEDETVIDAATRAEIENGVSRAGAGDASASEPGTMQASPAVLVQVRDPDTGQLLTMDASGNLVAMPEFQTAAATPSTGWGDEWNRTSPEARRRSNIPAIRAAQTLVDQYLPLLEAIGVPGRNDGGLPGLIGPGIAPSSEFVKRQIVDLLLTRVIPEELNAGRTFARQRTLIGEIQSAAYRALNARQQMAFSYFTSRAGGGWSAEAAVGIIASLTAESFLDPGRRQNDYLGPARKGIGLAQWGLGESRAALYNSLNRGYELNSQLVKTNAEAGRSAFFRQLSFINYELTNPQSNGATNYVNAGNLLRGARTVTAASEIFVRHYEAPGDIPGAIRTRGRIATDIWNNFVQRRVIIPRRTT